MRYILCSICIPTCRACFVWYHKCFLVFLTFQRSKLKQSRHTVQAGSGSELSTGKNRYNTIYPKNPPCFAASSARASERALALGPCARDPFSLASSSPPLRRRPPPPVTLEGGRRGERGWSGSHHSPLLLLPISTPLCLLPHAHVPEWPEGMEKSFLRDLLEGVFNGA